MFSGDNSSTGIIGFVSAPRSECPSSSNSNSQLSMSSNACHGPSVAVSPSRVISAKAHSRAPPRSTPMTLTYSTRSGASDRSHVKNFAAPAFTGAQVSVDAAVTEGISQRCVCSGLRFAVWPRVGDAESLVVGHAVKSRAGFLHHARTPRARREASWRNARQAFRAS